MSELLNLAWWIGIIVCWFKAVIYDVGHSNLTWTLVDFFIMPIGVIRGFILFFN